MSGCAPVGGLGSLAKGHVRTAVLAVKCFWSGPTAGTLKYIFTKQVVPILSRPSPEEYPMLKHISMNQDIRTVIDNSTGVRCDNIAKNAVSRTKGFYGPQKKSK